jgi:hypothetical protein
MKAGDDDLDIVVVPTTHHGQLRRIGGGRRRSPAAVHDGLESPSTLGGIRIPAASGGIAAI